MIGFSEGFHDAAVSVVKDGQIVFASHAERYSRKKHDKKLGTLLGDVAKTYNQDKQIAFFERPLLKKSRQFIAGQYKTVFKKRILTLQPTDYFGHHLSHAAAAFHSTGCSTPTQTTVGGSNSGTWDHCLHQSLTTTK